MKTIKDLMHDFSKNPHTETIAKVLCFGDGILKAQEFIPLEEEKPPYGEDILIQTSLGSIYFGKMHEGMNGKPDYFWPDLAAPEEILKIQQLKSWRPIFYK